MHLKSTTKRKLKRRGNRNYGCVARDRYIYSVVCIYVVDSEVYVNLKVTKCTPDIKQLL